LLICYSIQNLLSFTTRRSSDLKRTRLFNKERSGSMVFPSKRDIWIAIPIWALIIVFIRMLYEMITQVSVFGILISLIIIGIIVLFWFYTRYEIEDEL